jgi:hypothetical protein
VSRVDPAIVDAVNRSQTATLAEQVTRTAGAGKAYQAVAASAALAIQDAVDALRHAQGIATSASGMALAQFLASGDPRYLEALGPIQGMVDKATANLDAVGIAAAKIMAEFPSG